MFSHFRFRAAALALMTTVFVAACQRGPEPPAPECPKIAIVQDAREMTVFRPGPGRDLTDVTLEARVTEFGGFCETDIDDDDNTGEVEIDMQVAFEATRGPASDTRNYNLTYFIAIADAREVILARETFDIEIEFEGNRNRIGIVEELRQTIPLKAGQRGENYSVYIGLQLNDEQLQFNRRKLGR